MFNAMDTPFYEEEDDTAAAALFAIITTSILEAREARNEQRQRHRLYLCRQELIPDPRAGTPWQRLWESQNDRAFITMMGFDVVTFWLLLRVQGGLGSVGRPGRSDETMSAMPVTQDYNDVHLMGLVP